MTPRPTALTVHVAGIPEVMRTERRWVLWRYEWDGKRWTKIPYQVSGARAKSDHPGTWNTLAAVLACYRLGKFDGISYALGDGRAGLDIDAYFGQECPLIDQILGYRETSPGRRGIKIIGHADRAGGQINFETYPPTFTRWEAPRFFTVTGQDASGDPLADLSAFINEWFPAPITLSSTREGYALAAECTDDDLLCAMIAGDSNGDQILALWRGETSAYGGDHSRADLALCCHLAFWTNYDCERVDRLFRQSGLYRDKWDTTSYRRSTLQKALR